METPKIYTPHTAKFDILFAKLGGASIKLIDLAIAWGEFNYWLYAHNKMHPCKVIGHNYNPPSTDAIGFRLAIGSAVQFDEMSEPSKLSFQLGSSMHLFK